MISNIRRPAALLVFTALLCAAAAFGTVNPNSPTGTRGLILIDKRGAHIRFFDPQTYKELSSIATDTNPHEIGVSPDHRTAYAPIYGDGVYGNNPHPGHTILVLDLASRQVKATIDVSPYIAPHGVQVDSAGKVYVTCDLSRKLLVIDPQTLKVEAAIDTEGTGHWLAVLPDGSKAYIANKNDKAFISVIDLRARKMMGRVAVPDGTQGITASPDGKRVLAVEFGKATLAVIDTATDTVVDTVELQGNTKPAYRVQYSADGTKVLTDNEAEVMVNVLDAANLHGPQHTLKVGKDPMGFGFAPDGRTALVGNHGEGTVSVMDIGTGRVLSSFSAGTGIESLAYY